MGEWIKINSEDDLPAIYKEVIIYDSLHKERLLAHRSEDGNWCLPWSNHSLTNRYVTHWMEAPPYPEEK